MRMAEPAWSALLAVDEAAGSLTFAGDIPEGAHARLMKANFDRLIDGASGAADASMRRLDGTEAGLALLIPTRLPLGWTVCSAP